MRVLLGTAFPWGAGGVHSHLESLVFALKARGVESDLVFRPGDALRTMATAAIRSRGSIDRARVELTRARTLSVERSVRRAICRTDYGLLHPHDVLLASAISDLGLPVVLTVHGPLSREAMMLGRASPTYVRYLKEVEEKAYHHAHALITVDTGQREIVITDYHVPAEKVRVIRNAVDTELYKPSPGLMQAASPYLLIPRRLVPKNGVHVAIHALRAMDDAELRLLIAGDGPLRAELERLAASLSLKSRVRFLGAVDQAAMVRLVSAAAGVVIPSVPVQGVVEATSIAALEAMSSGKAVFASNLGGLREIIEDGQTGFLFEPGDSDGLGALLSRTLGDPDRLAAVGAAAREYVVAHHGLEVWVDQVLEVYRSVLHARTAPQAVRRT